MSELLFIALEAHHGERDHHRRYEVAVCRDLLGDWVATVAYGRAGQRLRRLQFGAADQEATRRFVHERLRRRLSAPRRIGCAYKATELIAGEGVEPGEWVPEGLVAKKLEAIPPDGAASFLSLSSLRPTVRRCS